MGGLGQEDGNNDGQVTWRAVIDEEVTYSDLSERVHLLKIMLRAMSGCDARDVWPIRNRILDMRSSGGDSTNETTCHGDREATAKVQEDERT